MKKQVWQDSIVLGFALFAMFFGAGNLIFPAGLGAAAGTQWPLALLATTLASIVMPLLAVVAVANVGDRYEAICSPVGRWYYILNFSFVVIGIALLVGLPRTAATTHEIGVAPFFPNIPIGVTVSVYFIIVALLSIDKSNVVDRIGKYLTPVLLILMIVIIIKGFLTPLGTVVETGQKNVFGNTFIELYSTGDLYSGLQMSSIFIAAIIGKGYVGESERKSMVNRSCIIAGTAFFVIYGGLLYLGANANGQFPAGIDRTALLSGLAEGLLGQFGSVALAISVALACISTAIALVALAADFFSSVIKGIPYVAWVIIECMIGAAVGTLGVENIINFSGPIFLAVYPSGIALTFLGLFKKRLPNMGAYRWCIIFALIAGCVDSLRALGVPAAAAVMSWLPLNAYGFGWILPTIAGFIFGWVTYRTQTTKER